MYFSDEDKNKIKASIIEAEKSNTGEIVPVIVKQSDFYPAAHFRASLLISFLAVFSFYQFNNSYDEVYYLYLFILGALFGFFIAFIPLIKRLFSTSTEMSEEFRQKAIESFLVNGVVDTKDRNGVQLYISALEHKAMILVDSGLKEKLPQVTWDNVINGMTSQLKKKNYTLAITNAIEEMGEILTENYPRDENEKSNDELANKLIIDL